MTSKSHLVKHRRRTLEFINLISLVIVIPLLIFIVGIIAGILILKNTQFGIVLVFVLTTTITAMLFNPLLGMFHFKILSRYLKHTETNEDIKSARDLTYVTVICILFLGIVIQGIYEILRNF